VVGIVRDQSQGVIGGAAVNLQSLEDNSTHMTTSANDGSFQFLNLKAGKYSVKIEKDGFSNFSIASLDVEPRQTARVEATLALAGASTSVEVNEAASVVNTENATLGDTKKFTQVVQLPMNCRGGSDSPLTALVAVPGVQQDSSGEHIYRGRASTRRRTRRITPSAAA
jgi:Carboxypeptidase regulatory-like domain